MEQAYEIASVPMGSAQLTHKQDHPHSVEHPDGAYQHTCAIYSLDWAKAVLMVSKHNYHCYRKSLTA